MTRIADVEVILADTGPFCRLAAAGETHFDVAIEYVRESVQIVMDVQRELRRRSAKPEHSRLNRLKLLGVPERQTITITEGAMLARIEDIIEGRRRHKAGHPDEDRGEVATALVAASMGVPTLMDDGWGKNFAINEGVQVFTTQDLAVELAATNALGARFAWGIYRIVYDDATREDFDSRVETFRQAHGVQ